MAENNNPVRVQSPCIRHCTLDDNDLCQGCYRTLEEILAWGGSSDVERKQILARGETRKRRLRSER